MLKFVQIIGVVLALANASPVTRIRDIELPGNEKIAKRDVEQVFGSDDDLKMAESTMVFLPFFRTRNGQSSKIKRSVNDRMDDMETADSSIVFLPFFRKDQYNRRVRRSDEDEFWFIPPAVIGKSEGDNKKNDQNSKIVETKKSDEGEKTKVKRSQQEVMHTGADMVFLPRFQKEYTTIKNGHSS